MNNLHTYIIEKLHINKDTKIKEEYSIGDRCIYLEYGLFDKKPGIIIEVVEITNKKDNNIELRFLTNLSVIFDKKERDYIFDYNTYNYATYLSSKHIDILINTSDSLSLLNEIEKNNYSLDIDKIIYYNHKSSKKVNLIELTYVGGKYKYVILGNESFDDIKNMLSNNISEKLHINKDLKVKLSDDELNKQIIESLTKIVTDFFNANCGKDGWELKITKDKRIRVFIVEGDKQYYQSLADKFWKKYYKYDKNNPEKENDNLFHYIEVKIYGLLIHPNLIISDEEWNKKSFRR